MILRRPDLAAVQEHPSSADALEDVVHLEVAERILLGEDFFKERPESGDVPLPVAQLIDEPAFGLLGGDAEGLVEGAARGVHPEVGIEDEERLADGIDDALGEVAGNRGRVGRCGFWTRRVRHGASSSRAVLQPGLRS